MTFSMEHARDYLIKLYHDSPNSLMIPAVIGFFSVILLIKHKIAAA